MSNKLKIFLYTMGFLGIFSGAWLIAKLSETLGNTPLAIATATTLVVGSGYGIEQAAKRLIKI